MICPECGRPDAFVKKTWPMRLYCSHRGSCGARPKATELFPNLIRDLERDYPPNETDPHAPARRFLSMRGLNASLEGLVFEYWPEKGTKKEPWKKTRTGAGGAVMFPLDDHDKIWNGRLFNPPGRNKGHNRGKVKKHFWKHPGRTYDPNKPTKICEGVIDALSWWEMGEQAIAVTTSGASPSDLDLSEFNIQTDPTKEPIYNLVSAFDNDPEGWKATRRWLSVTGNNAIMFKHGDANDFISVHGNESAAVLEKKTPEFETYGQLAGTKTANEYADIYKEFFKKPIGLFEFDRCYWYGGKREVTFCANFVVRTKHFAVCEDIPDKPETKFALEVIPRNSEKICCLVNASDLATADGMTKVFLNYARVVWSGPRSAQMALARRISESKSAPILRQLQFSGYDPASGAYVFERHMIDPNGNLKDPEDGFFCVGKKKYVKPAQHSTIKPEKGEKMTSKEIYKTVSNAWPNNGPVAMAWMTASFFVNQVKSSDLGFFPHLSLFGNHETGKSNLALTLNRMQCRDTEGLPMNSANTLLGIVRKISHVSGGFAALLEANAERGKKLDMSDFILATFNNNSLQVRAKKTNDSQVNETPLQCGIMFVQNHEPFNGPAEKSRVISLEFRREHITPETTAAFNKLKKVSTRELACFFVDVMLHRTEIENSWRSEWDTAIKALDCVNDPRIRETHAMILAFHNILSGIFKTEWDMTDTAIMLAKKKKMSCDGRQESLADFFFNTVNEMDEGTEEYCLSLKSEKGRIYINLNGIWEEAEKQGKRIRAGVREMQESLRDHPAYIDSNVPCRFVFNTQTDGKKTKKTKAKKAWVFLLDQIGAIPT